LLQSQAFVPLSTQSEKSGEEAFFYPCFSNERSKKMNKLITVGTARNGKVREATLAAKAIVDYLNGKYDLKNEVFTQLFGTAGTIFVIGEMKDLASIQIVQAKIMTDEAYWALVEKYAHLWEAPLKMTLLQSV
jgi:hypothetical protein